MPEEMQSSVEYTPLPINEDAYDNEDSGRGSCDSNNVETSGPIRDKFNLVQLILAFFGLVVLLPWFGLITPTSYWMYKFRNASDDHIVGPVENKTQLQKYFLSYLSICCNIPNLLGLLWCIIFGHSISVSGRNIVSLIGMTVCFFVTTALVYFDSDKSQNEFLYFTLITAAVLSAFGGIFQASITGLASLFPSKYMHSMITGQAYAGILSIVAQILILLGHFTPLTSGFFFFLTCDIIMLLSIILYFACRKTSFFKHNMRQRRDATSSGAHLANLQICFAHIWTEAISAFLVLFISLSVVPLNVLIVPEHPNTTIWTGRLFIPVCFLFIYNVGDVAGRKFGGYVPLKRRKIVLLLSCSRLLFIPTFMLCNVQPRTYFPVLIHSDAIFIFLVVLLAFSNGYVIVLPMMEGPKHVPPELRETAGFILSCALVSGVAFGSMFSLVLVHFT